MNLKALMPVAAIAIAGTLSAASSAEAFSIGSTYSISGSGIFTEDKIDFKGKATLFSATKDFAPLAPTAVFGGAFVFTPDTLDINVPTPEQLLVDFQFPDETIYDFTVTTAKFLSGSKRYEFKGFFGDGTAGVGELSYETLPGFDSYSASFTAVPTPALLPGLVGLGVAALRKRKDEATEEA